MKTDQLISFTKAIAGYENYRIDREGNVWSRYKPKTSIPTDNWKILKPILDTTGYFIVTLAEGGVRKNKAIHRLLALAFIPNLASKAHVNHIDADKQNNALPNLEWATSAENSAHAAALGLYRPSVDASRVEVMQLHPVHGTPIAEHESLHEAGRATGIAWQNIWKVCDGRRTKAGGFGWAYK